MQKIKVLWLFGFVLQVGQLYLKAQGVPSTSEGVSQKYWTQSSRLHKQELMNEKNRNKNRRQYKVPERRP